MFPNQLYLGWREMRQYKWQHHEDNIVVSIWNIIYQVHIVILIVLVYY